MARGTCYAGIGGFSPFSSYFDREYVTMSVFILSGPELKAMATLEGPVAHVDVDSGSALLDATERFRRGERFGEHTIEEAEVDFEHLQASFESEEDEEDAKDTAISSRRLDDSGSSMLLRTGILVLVGLILASAGHHRQASMHTRVGLELNQRNVLTQDMLILAERDAHVMERDHGVLLATNDRLKAELNVYD